MELDLDFKITEIANGTTVLMNSLETFAIISDDEYKQAADWLIKIKANIDRIEELRLFFTAPMNKQVKDINNRFKTYSEPLKSKSDGIKAMIAKYYNEQERIKNEEMRKRAEEAQKNNTVQEYVEEQKQSVRTESGLVTAKKQWTYEVYDMAMLKKKHPELFSLDEKLVTQYVKDNQEESEKDGLKIFQKTIISSRS